MQQGTDRGSVRRAGAAVRRGLAALVAAVVAWPAAAVAQQPGNSEAAAETSVHGGWLVIAAYAILWLGLMAYVAWLAHQQGRLDEEIDELEQRLDEELDV